MTETKTGERSPAIYYGWVVVLAVFVVYFVAFGIQYSYGIFLKPIETDLNWSRSASSWVMTLHLCVFAVGMFVAGWAIDRVGPKLVGLAGGVLVATGLVLSSRISSPWQLYITWGVFFGAGAAAVGPPMMTMIPGWFARNRGIATAIASCGVGVGTVVLSPLVNWLIGARGWRDSFTMLGIGGVIVIAAASLLLKKAPSADRRADKTAGTSPRPAVPGMTLHQAFHTRAMFLLMVAYVMYTTSLRLITVHIAPHMIDVGIAAATAAIAMSVIGGASIAGRVVMGTVQDRIGPRLTYTICLFSQFVSTSWLPLASTQWLFLAFALAYGFGYGGDVPQMPVLAASYFGLANIAFIYGTMSMISNVLGSLGPYLGGYLYDLTGSYTIPFIFAAVCSLIGSAAIFFSHPPIISTGESARHSRRPASSAPPR